MRTETASACPDASLSLVQIGERLQHHSPTLTPPDATRRAAVAMILREQEHVPQVLFIQRARHERDPWSGDIGFPGGNLRPQEDPHTAAVRETLEELRLDLHDARRLGQLDDLRGAHLPVTVSCLVFAVAPAMPVLHFNHEVADAFWYPLAQLLDPRLHGTYPVRFGASDLMRPGILFDPARPVLWGITYRLLLQFYGLLRIPFPPDSVTQAPTRPFHPA